jgi:hypothetical protein
MPDGIEVTETSGLYSLFHPQVEARVRTRTELMVVLSAQASGERLWVGNTRKRHV